MPISSKTGSKTNITSNVDPVVNKQNLGWLGAVLGSAEQAPIYIAGLLALIALLGMLCLGLSEKFSTERYEVVKILMNVVIASLTFLAGLAAGSAKK